MSIQILKPRYYLWLKISVINLLIVSILGVTLRYKIAFSLPVIDQKNLLHAHSHFAFTGWITQALLALLVLHLSKRLEKDMFVKYRWILLLNLISAFGMLIAFPIQGYGAVSISFSVLSIFASYFFVSTFWKDLNKTNSHPSKLWLRASLVFYAISSLGAFSLAVMMATHSVQQHWYLGSVYFFLHFQYNGWFFFAAMGLFIGTFIRMGIPAEKLKTIFILFAGACIPAYFLSILWAKIPMWVYIFTVIAAIAQVVGWFWLVKLLWPNLSYFKKEFVSLYRWLFGLSATALTIKLLLQAGSVIPQLSTLSYGFRPIIIGYLHLVLLGIFTLFLIAYFIQKKLFKKSKVLITGIIFFTSGIIINELLLMVQGIEGMNYEGVQHINEFLFTAALIMFTGLLLINLSLKSPSESGSLEK